MAAKAFARPEQTQSTLKIIRNALCATALAPSNRIELDVAHAMLQLYPADDMLAEPATTSENV